MPCFCANCAYETYNAHLLFNSHFLRNRRVRVRAQRFRSFIFPLFPKHNRVSRNPLPFGRKRALAPVLADRIPSAKHAQLVFKSFD